MTAKRTWGRKETIVWPPHAPIYTLCAFALGFVVTLLFVWQHLRFSETPLQQTYSTTYVETLVGATFRQTGTYRLLYVGGGKAAPRLAMAAIARDYAAKPENTIIVSPDNKSRQQINEAVREELVKNGTLAEDGRQFLTLSHRSDMTGPDRTWAAMYRPGDVVQYERGSKAEGIERGAFGVVRSSDGATNRLTVEMGDGSTVAYDPKRVYGVNVFRETSREFATGDRLQFSALNKELGIANRDMGTITKILYSGPVSAL